MTEVGNEKIIQNREYIMKKRTVSLFITALLFISLLAGCGGKAEISTGDVGVVYDEEFGNVYIEPTIDEFNAMGFAFGDSINITFDNGKSYEDIPYYSGYYCPVGSMLACGYPGYPHVVIARNYGASTWEEFEMTEQSRVTVTLNKKGKYLAVQELYALQYSDERSDFDSDIIFANYREVIGGNLKSGGFYRSASPCDNQHKRAACTNALAEQTGIKFVLNLSDNEKKYTAYTEGEDFNSAYYDSLYRRGNVLLLGLNANYRSESFAETVSEALLTASQHETPCLIHCVEGKDRTGFLCALILALADADAQEIIDDYMMTYYNYYGVTKEKTPDRYNAVQGNVNDFLYFMCDAQNGTSVDSLDIKNGAENYLRLGGLNDEQISQIEAYLTGK